MSVSRSVLSFLLSLSLPVIAAAQDPKPVRVPPTQRQQPPGPATVTARIVDVARVQITWDSVPGATTYHVGRHAPPNGWQRVATVPGTTLQVADTGRDLSVPHTYRVVAVVNDLASKGTESEPVKGLPPAGGPGTANAPARCDPAGGMNLRCAMTKVWAGSSLGEVVEVECPAGTYMMSGGYNSRLVGFHVTMSAPYAPVGGNQRWNVTVMKTPGVTVPATQRQELTVVALCRREQ